MSFIKKLFGSYEAKELKKIEPIKNAVLALEDKYRAMDEAELKAQTDVLKGRLAKGETLDDILPDAFAVCREAAVRVLDMKHFPVQIAGGIALHRANIAEMKTGEGKTLVATLPAYLNALEGKGVDVVTVNDYLAKRDSQWMGKLYNYLGLSVGLVIHGMTSDEKKAAYNADITYGTNNEFGFDYLRDNMVTNKKNLTQRGHNFAIVDEVDSILIDEARTPLIISGQGDESSEMYKKADQLAASLKVHVIKELDSKESHEDIEGDYIVDEKARTATLTAEGVKKAERFFGIENLSDPENILTSGIDILVHPPGKIVVHLDALSGGEKALVAIALYFAIMKVRPAPFCVMDEIEAALDDVNVYRFASYLRRLTDNTQFILITHRRGTMEEADVLYGVTMQDEGISKLLELRSTEVAEKLGIDSK